MNIANSSLSETIWNADRLAELNEAFKDASPRAILEWAYEAFGDDLAMATGFGTSGLVLMHIVSQIREDPTVFYLDTDLFFEDTYALIDRLSAEFGIRFTRVHGGLSLQEQAAKYGEALWQDNPDTCCFLRKVVPLRNYLSDKPAWVTGLRAHQSHTRARAQIFEWDQANNLLKINPLVSWTTEDVWSYIRIHDIPYNPLHDKGYPSIGCKPCTRAVGQGESERSGRWSGQDKTECGIHVQPQVA